MLTIAITNRNRDLRIVENCLNSLAHQSNTNFKVVLVDYGSEIGYLEVLKEKIIHYNFVEFISCPVQYQLWNKSRAINIALKRTDSKFFLVGDIDLIFHPDFINKSLNYLKDNVAVYFKYAFLSKEEPLQNKQFDEYEIDFFGGKEITGTTLFVSEALKELNGYDEFYHGWGAEDTDIHIRLKNFDKKISYIDSEVLIKHQWHPKSYRSVESIHPFHSLLERINHKYMILSSKTKATVVNLNSDWGLVPNVKDYNNLDKKADISICIENSEIEFSGLIGQLNNLKNVTVEVLITRVSKHVYYKQTLKRLLRKKHISYLGLQSLNNMLLEEIIRNYRSKPYIFNFDRNSETIHLKIKL